MKVLHTAIIAPSLALTNLKRLLCFLSILAALLTGAHAQSRCDGGAQFLGQWVRTLGIPGNEQANINTMIAKAKAEKEQGRQGRCQLILADVARLLLLREALK